MFANLPQNNKKRIVIIGGGFGGLKLAEKLAFSPYQVVLIDKHNYHQFQPLFYQVATAGLEPSAISFPVRKIFQKIPNLHFRMASVLEIDAENNKIKTSIGDLDYHYLVVAIGTTTNFFGMKNIEEKAMPMKSTAEALLLRNHLLDNYEKALNTTDIEERKKFMNIVVVGGGPTGVELCGTLAEMQKYIFPLDYPELNFMEMKIYLLEGSGKLLSAMSAESSKKAKEYLEELGVHVFLNTQVIDYDGEQVSVKDGRVLPARNLIWAAGVMPNKIKGIPDSSIFRGRIKVDRFSCIEGMNNVFAIGDVSFMTEEAYPNGHPQVAPVAIQNAEQLAKNIQRFDKGKTMQPFKYVDKGAMATIGRNKAVVDIKKLHFGGFIAWVVWMFVHLISIIGVKNKILVFINWGWNYITYDQSLRLIIKNEKNKPN